MGSEINALWTIAISPVFAFFLYNIWLQHQDKRNEKNIIGIKYFVIALVIWCLSGVLTLVYSWWWESQINVAGKLIYHIIRTVLSIANSAFLLLSIPSIEVGTNSPKEIFKKDGKNVMIYSLLVLLGTVAIAILILDKADFEPGYLPDSGGILKQPIHFVGILDLLFAFLVIWELFIRMTQAFRERKMEFMIAISWLLILFIFISQVLEVLPAFRTDLQQEKLFLILQPLTLLGYKTLLITFFIVLLYSWQLKENKQNQQAQIVEKNKLLNGVRTDLQTNINQLEENLIQRDHLIVNLNQEIFDKDLKIKNLNGELLKLNDSMKASLENANNSQRELSAREMDVLKLMNKPYSEIAKALNISQETVKSHVKSIKSKLGLNEKSAIVDYAIEHGFINKGN